MIEKEGVYGTVELKSRSKNSDPGGFFCKWKITVPDGYKVELSLEYLDLGTPTDSLNNDLIIRASNSKYKVFL